MARRALKLPHGPSLSLGQLPPPGSEKRIPRNTDSLLVAIRHQPCRTAVTGHGSVAKKIDPLCEILLHTLSAKIAETQQPLGRRVFLLGDLTQPRNSLSGIHR